MLTQQCNRSHRLNREPSCQYAARRTSRAPPPFPFGRLLNSCPNRLAPLDASRQARPDRFFPVIIILAVTLSLYTAAAYPLL